jgi:hypothetical protein
MALVRKAWNSGPRIVAGFAALVLTAAAVFYASIALNASQGGQGQGMALRAQLLLAVLVVSAAANWLLATRPSNRVVRVAANLSGGFNLVWSFSFIGLRVVVASLLGAAVATIPGPRRLGAILIGVAAAGFALGLLMFRLTQPPGEHIFG